jgi:hypothetical protein
VIFWANRNAEGTVVPVDDGWETVANDVFNPVGSTVADGVLAAFWKPWEIGMGLASFQATGGFSVASYVGRVFSVRGADLTNPIDVVAGAVETAAASTSVTVGAMTASPECLIVNVAAKFALNSGGGTSLDQSGLLVPAVLVGNAQTSAGDDATLSIYARGNLPGGLIAATRHTISGAEAHLIGNQFAIRGASSDPVIAPGVIASGEVVYQPAVANSGDKIIAPGVIASGEVVYAPRLELSGIVPAFIESGEVVFLPVVVVLDSEGNPVVPVVLQRSSADVFPSGTVVSIHAAHMGWPDRAPAGASLAVETVDELGRFSASGLMLDGWYVAYAFVGGKHRYLRFRYEASSG